MDYTVFRIASLRCEKAVSLLSAKGILVFDAKIKENDLYFKVKRNDRRKIIALFDEMCYTYQVVGEYGLFFRISAFFKRKGLVAGVLIAAVLLSFVNSRLNEIRINGLKTIEPAVIEAVLENEGIKKGVKTSAIDKKRLEYIIVSSVDKVAFASVKISGMTLIVNLYEELPPPAAVDMTKHTPVIAKKDGTVSRIVTLRGTPAVKAGEAVRAGDVLIHPYVKVGDADAGTRASGEVFAKVCYSGTAAFVENGVETVLTGRSESFNLIGIFGAAIGKTPASPYALFKTAVKTRGLFAPVPVKLTRLTYFELKTENVTRVFEEELPNLIERAKKDAQKTLPAGADVTDSWYVVRNVVDGGRVVEYYYEVEEKIS
ncbi:MAG: sporulation protein YqfD [Clostridiales bacterium]|jgi:similar to stage IV sporulation protein|nr:sporulation protein YqfD [Clostridiales bacterium]